MDNYCDLKIDNCCDFKNNIKNYYHYKNYKAFFVSNCTNCKSINYIPSKYSLKIYENFQCPHYIYIDNIINVYDDDKLIFIDDLCIIQSHLCLYCNYILHINILKTSNNLYVFDGFTTLNNTNYINTNLNEHSDNKFDMEYYKVFIKNKIISDNKYSIKLGHNVKFTSDNSLYGCTDTTISNSTAVVEEIPSTIAVELEIPDANIDVKENVSVDLDANTDISVELDANTNTNKYYQSVLSKRIYDLIETKIEIYDILTQNYKKINI